MCMKDQQNGRILHDCWPKNARILHNSRPKNIFPIFGGRGHVPPPRLLRLWYLSDHIWWNLGGNSEINLQPLWRRLVFGAPCQAVWLVDAGVASLATFLPVARVCRWRRYLPVFYRAGYQSQRSIRLACYNTHTERFTSVKSAASKFLRFYVMVHKKGKPSQQAR